MNLDELRSVQAKERRKDSLQHLRDDFYDEVAAYIADLRDARDSRAESVENPFEDDDVRRMSDEVETAEEVSEALYERRVGKVVKLASFAAADMSVEREGMTKQERALFADLVSRIEENKRTVLDVLSGEVAATVDAGDAVDANRSAPEAEPRTDGVTDEAPTPTADDEPVPPADPVAGTSDDASADDAGVLADAMGGAETGGTDGEALADDDEIEAGNDESDPAASENDGHTPVAPDTAPPGAPDASDFSDAGDTEEAASDDDESHADADGGTDDRTTVRITAEVGEILGVDDREYDLASEDVVTLPAANAEPLIQRDAAERID